MVNVRAPAAAGGFYPIDPAALQSNVTGLLDATSPAPLDVEPRLLIVPHAGYVYSGPIAATGYAAIDTERFDAALLLGPSHFVGFEGLALPTATSFATPLGEVPVDAELAEHARAHAAFNASAHRREHSLEVQLPFLQTILPGAAMLPVLTGDDGPEPGAALLASVAERPDVLLVVSSDLSHYLSHDAARRLDAQTADAIVELDPARIGYRSACGRTAIHAALITARRFGWRCRLLDLRTSGDTAGDRSRVVGYGAFALGPAN